MSQQHSAWQPMQTASFQESLATERLSERSPRTADHEAENRALRTLARHMAGPPGALLQRLVDIALDLGDADTAGVSLLESGPGGAAFFRRVALAGADAHQVNTTTPADSSSCGYALHRNTAQLYAYADGYQACGGVHFPDVVEKLVIPFGAHGKPYGTIWVATHNRARCFDAEDVRILQSLADFTAAALQLWLTTKENARLAQQIEADLEERRLADEARRHSEAKFRHFSESGLVSVAYFDTAGRVTGANDAFLRMIGYSREELKASDLRWEQLTPKDWIACTRDALDEFARTGRMQPHERQYFRRDGTRFWALVGAARMEGSHEGVAFVLDIDERKQVEQQSQQQHERLRMLWETAATALMTNDPPAMLQTLMQRIGPRLGIDAYFNHLLSESGDGLRLESYAGVPENATRDLRWLTLGDAGGSAAPSPSIADALGKAQQTQLAFIGSLEAQAYACYPLLADENRLLGTLSFFGRARPPFRADELEFLDTISRYVSIAYERLRLTKELRVSDRRKDEFLATLAHELRNPLAPIRNGLQLIGAPALNTEALGRVRAMMDRQLAQMVRLIDDLLDVSRITRGRIELRKQRVELATVLTSAGETVRPLIESLGHELLITLPPQPILLDADLTRLAQAFMNLLNNAAKYTESGGRIEVEATVHGSDVIVSVRDNGIGIPAEVLPNVFDLFVQGDRSLERPQGGLGVGLTLVKRLIEMHDGSIQAHSDGRGHGAEFTVRLPLATTHANDEQAEPMRMIVQGNQRCRRILVADDNRDAAESLATLLGLDGDDVRVAHNGAEAVELEERFMPDVVVLDIGMPVLNGYDAARRIRARGSKALLIALTGWGQENDKRSSREAGFDFHLVKPAEPETLRALLQQAGSSMRSEPSTPSTNTP
ncbi:MAG TPA: ATP-binding protein [Burkholderiales bacterium]